MADNRCKKENYGQVEWNNTDRIAGLLSENLGQRDHLRIALEPFGEVNHLVGRILLFARPCSGQKGGECSHGDRVALLSASCGKL